MVSRFEAWASTGFIVNSAPICYTEAPRRDLSRGHGWPGTWSIDLSFMNGYWRDQLKLSKFWSLTLRLTQLLAPLGLGVISTLIAIDYKPGWIYWALYAASVISGGAFFAQWAIDNSGCAFKKYVDAALKMADQFWDIHPDQHGEERFRFRITLFELKPISWWRWIKRKKWTHYLTARARFPRSGQRRKRIWFVHDHKTEACQGIAGRIFAKETILFTEELPDLHRKPQPNPADFEKYATSTGTTIAKLRADIPYSRVIGGMPVLSPDGKRWGVLVFDAPIPEAISKDSLYGDNSERFAEMLTVILSGGSL